MVAAAAGVLAAAVAALVGAPVAALAVAPPVRAAPASASRVPAALLDRHLERGPAPFCRAFRRRAPRADGNDLRAPGDDSQLGPPPTTRRQTCIDGLCAYLHIPCQRPGRVPRFPPPGVEKAWSEARPAYSIAVYTAAEMMCLPGHKGLNDRRAVRPSGCARHGQDCPLSASA